jgi:hypothetical protein
MSRALALKPDQEDLIWKLWLQSVPQSEIAARVGCSRTTVSNVVNRVRKRLAERRPAEFEELRTEALAGYDQIKREAWKHLENCPVGSSVAIGLLSNIIAARQAQDRLLGLQQITVNHRGFVLAKIDELLNTGVPLLLPGAEHHE